ncbi:hypothetical protein BCR22_05295 [Enterococcus plantarum]|uniref:winged helix-turn-helix transcriptional regulator n=1 Tax=Enterococcus TaxID=1350 RepID=UPI00084CFA7E|nr:winged helix-turn-helix domain-containing protein [Enterococcus plantarum]MBO0421313.1 response regulator transcription factor [Enterococcus plantarum]OEG11140.1 hypothetical protein BCR22_05295 [Enterococcus plantarum]
MCNIGIISSNNELENGVYANMLEVAEYNIHFLNLHENIKLNDATKKLDVLIIEEASIENQMSIICDTIIKVREQTSLLIWILSDTTDKSTRMVYLKLGADSIIDKTIDSEELILIIEKNLSRYLEKSMYHAKNSTGFLQQGSKQERKRLKLIHSNSSVLLNGKQEVSLTKLEFKTIELLSNHIGKVLTYEDIYENIWDKVSEDKQYRVTNIIYHLRRKLEDDYIKTVRSKGYMLMT